MTLDGRRARATRGLALGSLLAGMAGSACDLLSKPRVEVLAAGTATIFDATHNAFTFPMPSLPAEQRAAFFVGNSYFNLNWLSAPASAESRDGLGPLFSARSCSSCHFKDGRSRPPEPGEPIRTMLVRIAIPGRGPHGEALADPVYGDQIQASAIAGVPREADVLVAYQETQVSLSDGESVSLRTPRYQLEHLGYGPVDSRLIISPRVAPILPGLGLLEAIDERDLLALADPSDRDRDGVSGRANRVWDASANAQALGRFGWKAEQPSVFSQVASAFLGDLGLTSSLFSSENHSQFESAAAQQPNGGSPEVRDDILSSVALYARSLAVPARRDQNHPTVIAGEELFRVVGCAACHVTTWKTAPVADLANLGGQTIHPYTDLLLHDLGEGLSDGRPTFEASAREWRTAPLWGIGLVSKVNNHSFFLHDGRARNLLEAIIWHAGEASSARMKFSQLHRADRAALLSFLQSL
ncbi:MAG TPA: di-heme oxidoredictase family protein [Polyangiaceae bacterium]|nr:di-heme oxidoredictase family protein [Polyangiaceae bacterium]